MWSKCDVLITDLECSNHEDVSGLDGLVHFCNHVKREQDLEAAGMRKWLEEKGYGNGNDNDNDNGQEGEGEGTTAKCKPGEGEDGGMNTQHMNHRSRGRKMMSTGCGATGTASSRAFMTMNHRMHNAMSVSLSCDHKIDFVRQVHTIQ
jgi:hypothetical protein